MHLNPSTYRRHHLHGDDRDWVERNCSIDSWIEVLHAQGLDPMAMLPFVFAVDFQGDQWTFYKPSTSDLWDLYGVDVQELTIWQPLLEHVQHHVHEGRMVATESDAFFLPDTRGTDYRTKRTKTSIVIYGVDVDQKRLHYFHNAGCFELEGEDFAGIFGLGAADRAHTLPLYAELIRTDRRKLLTPDALRAASMRLFAGYVARRPLSNPVTAFARAIDVDLGHLQPYGLDAYHAYAFANIRQLGSAFELAALYLRWLKPPDGQCLSDAADACARISTTAKALILKAARAVHSQRPPNLAPMLDEAAKEWDRAMHLIDEVLRNADTPVRVHA